VAPATVLATPETSSSGMRLQRRLDSYYDGKLIRTQKKGKACEKSPVAAELMVMVKGQGVFYRGWSVSIKNQMTGAYLNLG